MTRTRIALGCTLCFVALAACDPVHEDAVAALGGETGGVRPGPRHRPGQPCLLCHDGAAGDPRAFSVAGTVYVEASGQQPADGATVELTGADGSQLELVVNSAGNFYASAERSNTPPFPLQVSVTYQSRRTVMHSEIGRDGSCAGCHADPPGPSSPGHVFVRLEDGGVPP